MRDIRRYWREVRALEASLPAFVWLVDVDGSSPVEVAAGRAAQLLIAKSHRAASQDEVCAQSARDKAAERELRRNTLRQEGIAVVTLSKL
ncbi:MAG TPA: hypothetical protein VLN48_14920 [Bryobacteraceae bacterium]|nr:hypothetical protein [Bryobacteraceae bacterium]